MILNFLNFWTLSQFFVVQFFFYSNHIFLPFCALTLKIQIFFFSLFYLFLYLVTGRLKKPLSKKRWKHEARKFAHENTTES